jgi:hypothetical protein
LRKGAFSAGCEAARRLLAGESRSAGQVGQTQQEHNQKEEEQQNGQGQITTPVGTHSDGGGGGGGGATWRDPTQLRALCMLSGAAIHWTLGSWCAHANAFATQCPLLVLTFCDLPRQAQDCCCPVYQDRFKMMIAVGLPRRACLRVRTKHHLCCRRTLAHRVLANEGDVKRPRSLLEQHSVPLLIVNAEHDIGCAKGT